MVGSKREQGEKAHRTLTPANSNDTRLLKEQNFGSHLTPDNLSAYSV